MKKLFLSLAALGLAVGPFALAGEEEKAPCSSPAASCSTEQASPAKADEPCH